MDTTSDPRGDFIRKMNAGLAAKDYALLTPRQEHLVREFVQDDGKVADKDLDLFNYLLRSNSA